MTDTPNKPTYRSVHYTDSWGYSGGLQLVQETVNGKDTIFSAEVEGMGTCAWSEVCYFKFHDNENKVEWSEELQDAFWKYIKNLVKDHDFEGGLVMMNLNKGLKSKNPKQPQWFVKCLDESPNLIWKGNWYTNKNHQPANSKVCPYIFRL